METIRIDINYYNRLKEQLQSDDQPWEELMSKIKDPNCLVIVTLYGRDYMILKFDPEAENQIKESYI